MFQHDDFAETCRRWAVNFDRLIQAQGSELGPMRLRREPDNRSCLAPVYACRQTDRESLRFIVGKLQQRAGDTLEQSFSSIGERTQRANLPSAVANVLGSQVVGGILPTGGLLPTEPELCAQFGVSRTVVREAVKLLSSKGLLRTSSGIGTWVPPASEWNFLDPLVFSWVKASGNAEVPDQATICLQMRRGTGRGR